MHKVKSNHVYAVPHTCVCRKVIEEIADDGLPCQYYDDVNLLTHKELETPPYTHYSLESQVAANQPIKRVSTLTMEPSELSQNQLQQLEKISNDYHADDNKVEQ